MAIVEDRFELSSFTYVNELHYSIPPKNHISVVTSVVFSQDTRLLSVQANGNPGIKPGMTLVM